MHGVDTLWSFLFKVLCHHLVASITNYKQLVVGMSDVQISAFCNIHDTFYWMYCCLIVQHFYQYGIMNVLSLEENNFTVVLGRCRRKQGRKVVLSKERDDAQSKLGRSEEGSHKSSSKAMKRCMDENSCERRQKVGLYEGCKEGSKEGRQRKSSSEEWLTLLVSWQV